MAEAPRPLILIVDDDPQSLHLLSYTLSQYDYEVAVAKGGSSCFKLLEKRTPTLILCDVIMPEMDGYEVCRRLKASEKWRDIPLIFLTARTETEDLLKGFEAGAVDYITKPFNEAELLARVHTHSDLKQAHDTILAYSRQLEQLNQQLKVLNSEKSHFLGVVSHDLKNPLTAILMSAEMAEEGTQELLVNSNLPEYLQMIQRNAQRMHSIITRLLDVSRLESGKLAVDFQACDLKALTVRLLEQYEGRANRKRILLHLDSSDEAVQLVSDADIIQQIVDNLISNAIKYSPWDRNVYIKVAADREQAWLQVRDEGPGFTPEDKNRLFQKFSQLSARPTAGESSTGLGLSIAQHLSKLLHGSITCESQVNQGATFTLYLPRSLSKRAEEIA